MPHPLPHRSRRFLHRFRGAALAAGLLALPAGCESLRTAVPPEASPAPQARGTGEAAPAPNPLSALVPGKHATRPSEYYVLYHDFPLDPADPLFSELENLPLRVFEELRLPPGNAMVQVFLFDAQERYERFMRVKYPNLPPRRAYFIAEPKVGGGPGELKVFTWMGDHLRTDLRHELTHAILHGVLKDVPLWLDEGLAGFFELPPEADGLNAQHLDVLRRGEFQPDMARLEKFEKVKQMEKPEYREAWAWVHLMLRGRPEMRKALQEHLQALRTNPSPGPLLPKLREAVADPERALVDHLAGLEMPQRLERPRGATPR